MTKTLLDRLTVKYVHDGHVVCTGLFPACETRDRLTGTPHPPQRHSLLEPVIHLTDLQPKQPVKVGDVILRYDDRSLEHQPV